MGKTEYTITNVEDKKTSKGDPMKALHLSNGDTVNIFQHHNRFGVLKQGDKIAQDELYVNSSGYVDLKDQPGDSRPDSAEPYKGKVNEMDEAMTRKELGIKMSSTARMAADMVTAEIEAGHIDKDKLSKQDRWRMWRSFFIGWWDEPEEFKDVDEIFNEQE